MVLVHVVLYVWYTLSLELHIGDFHFYFLVLITPHLKKSWPFEVGPSSFLCHVSLVHHSSNICNDNSTWLLWQHKYLDNSPQHLLFYSPHFQVVISLNILIKNRMHIFGSRAIQESIHALTILSWMFWFWYLCQYGIATSISFVSYDILIEPLPLSFAWTHKKESKSWKTHHRDSLSKHFLWRYLWKHQQINKWTLLLLILNVKVYQWYIDKFMGKYNE